MLDTILNRKAQITVEITAHLINIEMHGADTLSKYLCQRRLSGSGKSHNQNTLVWTH